MTRTMGDAIHDQVPALHAAGTEMVAGYVTGSPDIVWTAADWALFAGRPQVMIDQGFTGSPVASANVLDVEQGAWTPAAAVGFRPHMTSPRPTAYSSLAALPQLAAAGWQGDVWVADWTGSAPGSPPAVPAGMTCVAVQWTNQGGGGAYDLSVVFDPYWPEEAPVAVNTAPAPPGRWKSIIAQGIGVDGNVWVMSFDADNGVWTNPVQVTR
jgi:hypothetical protein